MRYSLLSTAIIGAATVSGLAIPEMEARSNHELDNTCQVQEIVVVLTPLDQYVGETFDLLTPEVALSGLVDSFHNITNPDEIDVNSPTGIIPQPELISYNPTEFYSTIANVVPTAAPSAEIPGASGGSAGELPPFPTGGLGGVIGGIGDQIGDMASGIMGTGTGGLSIPTGLPGLGDIGDSFSSYLNEIPDLSTALDYLTRSYDSPIPIPTDSPTSSIPTPTAPFPVPGGNGTTTGGPSGTSALPTGIIPTTTSESSTTTSSTSSSSSSTSSTSTSSSSTATPEPTGCASPRVRPEWRNMPPSAKQAYADAIGCLLDAPSSGNTPATNRFEDLAYVHQQMTPTVHGTGQFLAWHRYFLHMQETVLRNECGYTGPIPWWDETRDAGNFAQSPVFDPLYLGSAIVKTSQGQGACVNNGVMEGRQINIGPGRDQNVPRCLARAIDEGLSANVNNNFWSVCNGRSTYADMASCSEGGPHGYGHNAVGGVMADVASSPTDPVFYLHHGMIDRAWMMWQRQSANHAQAMGGTTSPGGNSPTTRDFVLNGRGIIPDVTIEQVMDTEGEYLCYTYDY